MGKGGGGALSLIVVIFALLLVENVWGILPSTSINILLIGQSKSIVVVWHPLGANCCEGYTKEFIDMLQKETPNTKIISIRIGRNPSEDSNRSYFDDANRQVEEVCQNLKLDPALKGGFNAIGLSQGGLLMRALVEKCTGLNVKTLTTFGSPLQGVAAYPGCGNSTIGWAKVSLGWISQSSYRGARERLLPCSLIHRIIGASVYSTTAQSKLMPAQYSKDPNRIPEYLRANKFLVDINNELPKKNRQYKENFKKLTRFTIYSYEDEEIVYPKESTNFGYFDEKGQLKKMRDLPIFKEDWIGLKELDQRKAIIQIRLPGEHVTKFLMEN